MGLSHFAYRILSSTWVYKKLKSLLSWLEPYLMHSGLDMSLRRYVALMIFLSIICFSATLPFALIIHIILLKNILFATIATLIMSLIIVMILNAIIIYFPVFKAKSRLEMLEIRLPYIVSYMAVLSYAGRNIESIIARLAEKGELFGIKDSASRMFRKISMLGQDTATMLIEEARKSPSAIYSSLLEGLAGIVETGKGLSEFLQSEFMNILRVREAKIKEIINSISVLMEVFISLVIVMPLVLTIMLSIMASLGTVALPLNPLQILFLVHFVITPTIAIMILLMIDFSLSKVSG